MYLPEILISECVLIIIIIIFFIKNWQNAAENNASNHK